MSYAAAELNTRITLARFESYRDSDGILHESWTTYAETFAKVGEIPADSPSGIFFTTRAARTGF